MTVIGRKVGGGVAWLGEPAAVCWLTLVAQGMPDDGITDAGRTEAEQADMWARYLRGELPATAAKPNTPQAHHQDQGPDGAHAVDARGRTQLWLIAHHPPCWTRPLNPPEFWHWEHDRARCPHQEGTEMDAAERKLLEDTRTEVANIQRVVARLDRDVLAPHTKLDTLLQGVSDIRTGVGGLPALIAAANGSDVDPEAIAREVAAHLPGYTVTITPQETRP